MVELIFALVIMGIVLLSAPMLIQQSIKSSNVAFQQESIAAIAAHTGMLLSKHWDDNNTQHTAGVSPVLRISNPAIASPFNLAGVDFDNNVSGRTSTIASEEFNASTQLIREGSEFNDVDDYNNFNITLTVFNAETSTIGTLGDYRDTDIKIETQVTYADDRPVTPFNQSIINANNNIFTTPQLAGNLQSNIKFITTILTTDSTVDELNKTITFQAFSCNLGTYSIGKREYK